MVDLNLYKSEKAKDNALELLKGLLDVHFTYERFQEIAEDTQGKYCDEEVRMAKMLTEGDFFDFVGRIKKMG